MSNIIRIVKPNTLIKINNHLVYREDDTESINLDELSKNPCEGCDSIMKPCGGDMNTFRHTCKAYVEYVGQQSIIKAIMKVSK